MLERYREIAVYKEDIDFFIKLVQNDIGSVSEIQLRSIAKAIIFFKRLFLEEDSQHHHYAECFISDLLNLLHSLCGESQRLYYTTYRSLIENFVRVLLKYDNSNDTGVRNMINELRDKYKDKGVLFCADSSTTRIPGHDHSLFPIFRDAVYEFSRQAYQNLDVPKDMEEMVLRHQAQFPL